MAVTTSWPTWVMFEQMAAMHDVPFATLSNGFEGLGAELRLTSPLFVKQMEYLLALQKDGMFRYGGRDNAADGLFVAGEAAMDNARDATQVHGGYGFMNEYPVARQYRDSKILEIGEGTSEVQLMLIARELGL